VGKKSQRKKARAEKRNRDPHKTLKKQKKREERLQKKMALLGAKSQEPENRANLN
jgi:hypothetical protein